MRTKNANLDGSLRSSPRLSNQTSMTPPKIISTGPVEPLAIDILQPLAEVVVTSNPSQEELAVLLKDAVGVILRGEGLLTTPVIEAAPTLKVIARSGVGYNNVAVEAATARKIPVVFTPGAGARAVAEASMAWILALAKRIFYWDQQFKQGNWGSRFETRGADLEGATLGIVGFGRIGQDLARLAAPFDMQIVAHDPFVPVETAQELGVTLLDLDDLLSRSDFVCLHAASTEENRGMIHRAALKNIKRGAYLINLARGELIENLDILQEALEDGRLAGVGLDVFAPEPAEPHPVFKHPNCLTAPHALAATQGSLNKIFHSMATDMAAILRGERPRFVVNPEVFD